MTKTAPKTRRSEIAEVMHGMIKGFERAGLVDMQTRRRFDESCLTSATVLSPEEIKPSDHRL